MLVSASFQLRYIALYRLAHGGGGKGGGHVLHHVKREGKYGGGGMSGEEYVRERKCVLAHCSATLTTRLSLPPPSPYGRFII